MAEKTYEEIQAIRDDVKARYPHLTFPDVVLEPLWFGRRPVNRIDGYYAIVDQNTDYFFNTCTDIYKPLYHEEVIDICEKAAAAHPEFGTPEMKISLLANGGKIKVEMKFPEVNYEVKSGDSFNPLMDVFSSYDLGWKYKNRFGAFRQICSNGAIAGEIFSKISKRHLQSLEIEELSNTLELGMRQFSEQAKLWQGWAVQRVLPSQYTNIWDALEFSKTEREKIEKLPETGTGLLLPQAMKSKELTLWSFYNVLTQFVTHEIRSELRQVELLPDITKIFEKYQK